MAKPRVFPLDPPATAKAALQLFAAYPNPKQYRLRPPATEEAIVEREEKLGCRLPAELREALLVHNGIRETYVNTKDYLGGTTTLSKLRADFRRQWTEAAEEFEEDIPLRFGRRYLVLGAMHGTGHDFLLLDTQRVIDGVHPVVRIDLDDCEEVQGFRSLAHYLHYVLLDVNGVDMSMLRKLFPTYYSTGSFRRMMRQAEKVERT